MKTSLITAAIAILALYLTSCASMDVGLSYQDGKTTVALRPTLIFEK